MQTVNCFDLVLATRFMTIKSCGKHFIAAATNAIKKTLEMKQYEVDFLKPLSDLIETNIV